MNDEVKVARDNSRTIRLKSLLQIKKIELTTFDRLCLVFDKEVLAIDRQAQSNVIFGLKQQAIDTPHEGPRIFRLCL
jgi:hypothetical protein